jgi:hypothetical protein
MFNRALKRVNTRYENVRKIHVISLGENPPTLEDFRQSISCALGVRSLLFTLRI